MSYIKTLSCFAVHLSPLINPQVRLECPHLLQCVGLIMQSNRSTILQQEDGWINVYSLILLQALNQVVLWDKIVMREDNQLIDLKSVDPEYYFFDDGRGLL